MVTMAELLAQAEKNNKGRTKPKHEEHTLQCACVRWFRFQYPHLARLFFAVPNGVRTFKSSAAKAKAEGMVAGVADTLLLVQRGGSGGLCLEFKTAKGRQSDAQKEWQREVERQGYRYVVIRTIEQFISTINEYLRNEQQ